METNDHRINDLNYIIDLGITLIKHTINYHL